MIHAFACRTWPYSPYETTSSPAMIVAGALIADHLLEPSWPARNGKDSLKKRGSFAKESFTRGISVRNSRVFTCSMGNFLRTYSDKIHLTPDGSLTAFLSLSRPRRDLVGFMSRRVFRMRGKQIRLSLTPRQDLDVSLFSKARRNHVGLFSYSNGWWHSNFYWLREDSRGEVYWKSGTVYR